MTDKERACFERRMQGMGEWVSDTIVPGFRSNINYIAASAAVNALMGQYFGEEKYTLRGKKAAEYVFAHFTENGLLCGEGLPHDYVTERGCRLIDIGYNVEESTGMLIRYAKAVGDEGALERLTEILRQQLAFMLPDGAWDNSFGTRTAKWTYWGSRTSDGCQSAYSLLAERDSMFAEAAYRNKELMERCTAGGLLCGGPEYEKHGELPCIHHSISHCCALATALDAGIEKYTVRTAIPADQVKKEIAYFPETDTYKLSLGEWRATVTGCDFCADEGHASGGTMTLLWHRQAGTVLLSSVVDYRLVEPLNMQLSLKKSSHRPLTPRLEKIEGGKRYSFCYDTKAEIKAQRQDKGLKITSDARLVSLEQQELPVPVACRIVYTIDGDSVRIEAQIFGPGEGIRLVVPVIAEKAQVIGGPVLKENSEIFFLTGGFCAREFILEPDRAGKMWIRLTIS